MVAMDFFAASKFYDFFKFAKKSDDERVNCEPITGTTQLFLATMFGPCIHCKGRNTDVDSLLS